VRLHVIHGERTGSDKRRREENYSCLVHSDSSELFD
jgi:hypothetical protein